MAKKNNIKKVSIAQLEKYADEFDGITTEVELSEDVVMAVNYTLTFSEADAFVNTVVDTCFDDDGNYLPEYKHAAICYCVASLYGNIRMPSDTSKGYELLVKTNICHDILEHVSKPQYLEILKAIDEKIKYRCDVSKELIQTQLNNTVNMIEDFSEMIENLFEGINEEDIKALVRGMDGFKLDEGKVVEAFIDRGMNNK